MSMRELVFRVSMAGASEFARDLKGLNDLIRKAGTEEVAITRTVSNQKRAAKNEEQKHNAAMLRTQIALEKARAKESVREHDRAEKEKIRAAARSEKEQTRTAQAAARERLRAEQAALRDSIRLKHDEQRSFERAEKEKTRIASREAKARQREEESTQRAVMRAQEATSRHMMQQRQSAQRQASREEYQRQRDVMFDHKRLFRGIGSGLVDGAYGAVRTVYGAAGGMARSVSGGLGLNKATDVQDIVAQESQLRTMMRSVAIEARTAGGKFGGFDEKGALEKIRLNAQRYGLSQRDLGEAVDVYSEKGSGATAVTNIHRIASQAQAMGSSASTVAKLRAQMGLSSGVSGKELSEDEKDDLIAKMHFVGKTGVFRAEDIAKESESLFSSFAKNGGDFKTGFTRFISFANEARKSTGSGAMARTAINSVQDQIAKKESKINSLGIKTRDADGGQRDFIEVVMDTIQKTGAKGKDFNTIFDPAKSGKAIATMVSTFQAAGGGKTGRAAMEKLLEGDASIKSATVTEMMKDTSARLDDPAVKIQQSIEKIRQAIAVKLAPVLDALAKKAPQIADAIGKAFDWIQKNPALAMGGMVAAGAGRGAALPMAGAAMRFAGDSLANFVPGFGGRAGRGMSALGGAISSAGAQNVYVTGAAPGVMTGGVGGGGGAASGSGAGMAVMGAAIGAALGIAIGTIINDTLEREKQLKTDAAEWRREHPNAGAGMAVKAGSGGLSEDDDYLRKRYGPGAKNPDGESGDVALAKGALVSPYEDPADYARKYLSPSNANSPYASPDDAEFENGGTGTFRFDQSPGVNAAAKGMPVKPGQAGYGVMAPQPMGAPEANPVAKESKAVADALAELTKQLNKFSGGVNSAFKPPPSPVGN